MRDGKRFHGYWFKDFEKAFGAYLPPDTEPPDKPEDPRRRQIPTRRSHTQAILETRQQVRQQRAKQALKREKHIIQSRGRLKQALNPGSKL